jgi:hypothetical protein
MRTTLLILLLGCSAEVEPIPSTPEKHALWRMYTHSGCDGAIADREVLLCVGVTAADALVPGDAQAEFARRWWLGSCLASYGKTEAPDDGTYCWIQGTQQPAPFGCSAEVSPTYNTCEP